MNGPHTPDPIAINRRERKWSKRELLGRVAWSMVSPAFRYSPRLMWSWRRWLLRCFGATVGKQVRIDPSARIFIPWNLSIDDWSSIGFDALLYNLGPLTIGKRVTVSQRAHLCGGSHDYHEASMPLLKCPIVVEDDVWLCADCFIGPNVRIDAGAIVAARAVVVRDVPANMIVGGHPAKVIHARNLSPKPLMDSAPCDL